MPPASAPISTLTRMNSTLKDLFLYIYDLSPLEMDMLIILIKNKKAMTLEELAKKADRDKSTIFRSLQKMVSLGICSKETKTIKEGGHYHVYSSLPIEVFKMETEKKVKELEQGLHRILKKFEADMEKMVTTFYQQHTNKKK
jgi:predicted transcriptional regulator